MRMKKTDSDNKRRTSKKLICKGKKRGRKEMWNKHNWQMKGKTKAVLWKIKRKESVDRLKEESIWRPTVN